MKNLTRKTKLALAGLAVVAAAGAGVGIAGATGGDDDGPLTGDELDRASAAALEAAGGGRVTDSERDDDSDRYEVEVTLDDGTEVDVDLDRDFEVVTEERDDRDDDGSDGDDDRDDLRGRDLERASAAALEAAGGGRVTDAESDAQGFEVEVTLDDGTEVDVYLDRDFAVVDQVRDDRDDDRDGDD
jgi:uncharacterized membrane protein YkoI